MRLRILFLLAIPFFALDTRCQFVLRKETNCTQGLLHEKDFFRIERIINATAKEIETEGSVLFQTFDEKTGKFSFDCGLSLKMDCIHLPSRFPFACFCRIIGTDQRRVTLRRTAYAIYNHMSIKAKWKQTETINLPRIYMLNSAKVGFLQDKVLSSYSQPCHFPVFDDNLVKYCCKNTASPCVSSIEYRGRVIAEGNPCATFEIPQKTVYVKPFRFQHKICGQPGENFVCVASYELKSQGDGYIQGRKISRHSRICRFPVRRDNQVKYCCENTTQPCISAIVYDGTIVSQNRSCAVLISPEVGLSNKRFRFYHNVGDRLGAQFICVAIRGRTVSVTAATQVDKPITELTVAVAVFVLLVSSLS